MLSYIIGKITSLNKKTITVESNWTGYVINVTNPEKFEVNKVRKIYVYKHCSMNNKNTMSEDYYGFYYYEEKELFFKLISLNGIGPKTAMQILKNDINLLRNLIISKDINGLSGLTAINEKIARQMIENITLNASKSIPTSNKISELVSALKSLGYEKKEIESAIADKQIIDSQNSIDISDLISIAIKVIATGENNGITKTNQA